MAFEIIETCVNCYACEPLCPNQAIYQASPHFLIDPDKCTECKGFHDEPQCAAVCPVDCCVPDEERVESEEELMAKQSFLHRE